MTLILDQQGSKIKWPREEEKYNGKLIHFPHLNDQNESFDLNAKSQPSIDFILFQGFSISTPYSLPLLFGQRG